MRDANIHERDAELHAVRGEVCEGMGVTDLVANGPTGRQRPSTSAEVTPGLVEGFLMANGKTERRLDSLAPSERPCPTPVAAPSAAEVEHLFSEWAEVAKAILLRREAGK
jgi:hypothetical protein